MMEQKDIIIYRTPDGKSSVALFAKDGKIWLNQKSIAELFGTSKQSVSRHIINILNDCELEPGSVVKDFLTTADDEDMRLLEEAAKYGQNRIDQ